MCPWEVREDREGPETQTVWKSESITNGQTNQLTGVGVRDIEHKHLKRFCLGAIKDKISLLTSEGPYWVHKPSEKMK